MLNMDLSDVVVWLQGYLMGTLEVNSPFPEIYRPQVGGRGDDCHPGTYIGGLPFCKRRVLVLSMTLINRLGDACLVLLLRLPIRKEDVGRLGDYVYNLLLILQRAPASDPVEACKFISVMRHDPRFAFEVEGRSIQIPIVQALIRQVEACCQKERLSFLWSRVEEDLHDRGESGLLAYRLLTALDPAVAASRLAEICNRHPEVKGQAIFAFVVADNFSKDQSLWKVVLEQAASLEQGEQFVQLLEEEAEKCRRRR